MKPMPRSNSTTLYEKVKTDDFIPGIIEDIKYEEEHLFKGYGKDKNGNQIKDKTAPGVRFKFKLSGYEYAHYSSWLTFNYGEKSNLYSKYLLPLVEGAKPDMDFDLDQLKGVKVKTLWVDKKSGFQSVETIRPIGKKVVPLNVVKDTDDMADVSEENEDEEIPF